MAIATLQREALSTNSAFRAQVNEAVRTEALSKNTPTLDDKNRSIIASVSRTPDAFAFPETIVADVDWAIKFDAYAADPTTAAINTAIQSNVEKVFNLLTGYSEPVVEP